MPDASRPPRGSHGFWAFGEGEYLKALREEEMAKLRPLEEALDTETDRKIQAELKAEITVIRQEFKEKRRAAKGSLFLKT